LIWLIIRSYTKEAKESYEKARIKSAAYNDANRNSIFNLQRSEQTKLENEMNLQFQAYSQVSAQLKMAEAKVQENTPAFTLLQPATVPVKKAGPRRVLFILIFLMLSGIVTTVFVLYKEDRLLSLLAQTNKSNRLDNEEFFILSKSGLKS